MQIYEIKGRYRIIVWKNAEGIVSAFEFPSFLFNIS
jgi:hypothetical protein